MPFQLSTDPQLQSIQLQELIIRSTNCLRTLTGPIDFRHGQQLEEASVPLYDKRELAFNYLPPSTRFAKLGNTNFTSLDFN